MRLGVDRRHVERDVGLGEHVAELPLLSAQQMGWIGIADGILIGSRIQVELSDAAHERIVRVRCAVEAEEEQAACVAHLCGRRRVETV